MARVSGTDNAHRRWLQRLVRAQTRLFQTNSHKKSFEQPAGRAATFAPKEAQPAALKCPTALTSKSNYPDRRQTESSLAKLERTNVP